MKPMKPIPPSSFRNDVRVGEDSGQRMKRKLDWRHSEVGQEEYEYWLNNRPLYYPTGLIEKDLPQVKRTADGSVFVDYGAVLSDEQIHQQQL
eukprot:12902831-Prorocentrum_lima.AAC.1